MLVQAFYDVWSAFLSFGISLSRQYLQSDALLLEDTQLCLYSFVSQDLQLSERSNIRFA